MWREAGKRKWIPAPRRDLGGKMPHLVISAPQPFALERLPELAGLSSRMKHHAGAAELAEVVFASRLTADPLEVVFGLPAARTGIRLLRLPALVLALAEV